MPPHLTHPHCYYWPFAFLPHHHLPVCGNGYGGSFAAGSIATPSGCAICPAGTYGSQIDQSTACKSCKNLGPQAISAMAGAASCTNCTGTSVANANATACVNSGGGEIWDGF